ncbi:MAG TPA: HEAT repeat domain-containing protein [Pirellulales bacterium]|nr:HEAT repeat domain-containing protein [Pirellulales bacterium]
MVRVPAWWPRQRMAARRSGALPRFRVKLHDYFTSNDPFTALSAPSRAAVRFLNLLSKLWETAENVGEPKVRLIAFRRDFRRLIAAMPVAGLIWCVHHDGAKLRRLAIWLLGYGDRRLVLSTVMSCSIDRDVTVRKEVVRALRHLAATEQLGVLMENEADPRVRRLAGPPRVRVFDKQLSGYLAGGKQPAQSTPSGARGDMFVVERIEGRKPKSSIHLRAALESIRRRVRGDGGRKDSI